MTTLSWLTQGSGLLAKADIHRFMKECLVKVGSPEEHAQTVADVLVEADYRGFKSHGYNRLDLHLSRIQSGKCDPTAAPQILSESPATAWVDGCNGLGPVVGNFCMRLAMRKAHDTGVSAVSVRGSNHFGINTYYANQALEEGLMGFCCTNTIPCVAPTRAAKAFLGSNPLCLAAPSLCGDSFVLDMSTSSITLGTVELMNILQKPLPWGWACDRHGHVTSDPEEAKRTAMLLPLGGDEAAGGYKGSALAFMVEALCGILAGGAYGVDIPRWWDDPSGPTNLSHFFMVIDPKAFAPGFEGRLFDLMNSLRDFKTRDQVHTTQVAGDPERAHMKKVDCAGGISYHSKQLAHMKELSETLDVAPVQLK